ncbi:MAG: SGNH hydrolase domain-containing protein, partial [Paracoccaceae bacterium]|nr:SGNH hydrolase domain-containing protein [Paracoccaceae bacterium]
LPRSPRQRRQRAAQPPLTSDLRRLISGAEMVARDHGATIIKSEPMFYPDRRCVSRLGDLPLYMDDDHVSVLGALMLAIEIDPVIRDMLKLPLYPNHRLEMENELMGGSKER